MPDQILVTFVPELTLYGFGCRKGRFPEFLKTLENRTPRRPSPQSLSCSSSRWTRPSLLLRQGEAEQRRHLLEDGQGELGVLGLGLVLLDAPLDQPITSSSASG